MSSCATRATQPGRSLKMRTRVAYARLRADPRERANDGARCAEIALESVQSAQARPRLAECLKEPVMRSGVPRLPSTALRASQHAAAPRRTRVAVQIGPRRCASLAGTAPPDRATRAQAQRACRILSLSACDCRAGHTRRAATSPHPLCVAAIGHHRQWKETLSRRLASLRWCIEAHLLRRFRRMRVAGL